MQYRTRQQQGMQQECERTRLFTWRDFIHASVVTIIGLTIKTTQALPRASSQEQKTKSRYSLSLQNIKYHLVGAWLTWRRGLILRGAPAAITHTKFNCMILQSRQE